MTPRGRAVGVAAAEHGDVDPARCAVPHASAVPRRVRLRVKTTVPARDAEPLPRPAVGASPAGQSVGRQLRRGPLMTIYKCACGWKPLVQRGNLANRAAATRRHSSWLAAFQERAPRMARLACCLDLAVPSHDVQRQGVSYTCRWCARAVTLCRARRVMCPVQKRTADAGDARRWLQCVLTPAQLVAKKQRGRRNGQARWRALLAAGGQELERHRAQQRQAQSRARRGKEDAWYKAKREGGPRLQAYRSRTAANKRQRAEKAARLKGPAFYARWKVRSDLLRHARSHPDEHCALAKARQRNSWQRALQAGGAALKRYRGGKAVWRAARRRQLAFAGVGSGH